MLDETEFRRWFESARRTLESAKRDAEAGDYNWACFKAHQAAEKALKALLWGLGKPKTGHSLPHLLAVLEEEGLKPPREVVRACMLLNKLYIPTRYPDAWSEGIPEEYFDEEDANEAIRSASLILEWVDAVWRELSRSGCEKRGKR